MEELDKSCAELQRAWREGIPVAAAMGVEVASFDGDELVVRAPLAPNINVHGTAFAGSLFSVCVLTCWGAAWLIAKQRGLEGDIVAKSSRIEYRRPVAEPILCRCRFDSDAAARLGARDGEHTVTVPLRSAIEARGATAVRFEGAFSVRVRPPAR